MSREFTPLGREYELEASNITVSGLNEETQDFNGKTTSDSLMLISLAGATVHAQNEVQPRKHERPKRCEA